jgi:hydrogenase nickel incorporation protein HypA/HybF
MHEFALAEAVVRAVLQTAESEGMTAVTRVAVRVGELQSIQRDTFEFALQQVRGEDPRMAGAAMEVEIVPARFACRDCEHVFTLAETGERDADAREAIHFVPELAHAFMRCPACGSPDFDVADGRGVDIAAIEGEMPDA